MILDPTACYLIGMSRIRDDIPLLTTYSPEPTTTLLGFWYETSGCYTAEDRALLLAHAHRTHVVRLAWRAARKGPKSTVGEK